MSRHRMQSHSYKTARQIWREAFSSDLDLRHARQILLRQRANDFGCRRVICAEIEVQ